MPLRSPEVTDYRLPLGADGVLDDGKVFQDNDGETQGDLNKTSRGTEDGLPLGTNNGHGDEDVLEDDYGAVLGMPLGRLDVTEDGLPLGTDGGPDDGEVFVGDDEEKLEVLLDIQYQKTLVSVVL